MTDKFWRTNEECREVCRKLADIAHKTGVSYSDLLVLWEKGYITIKKGL